MFNSLRRRREVLERTPVVQENATTSSNGGIARRLSEETLSTLIDDNSSTLPPYEEAEATGINSDMVSLLTTQSEETIYNRTVIFNTPISRYTKKREMPVVSNFLSPGAMVFRSTEDLKLYKDELGGGGSNTSSNSSETQTSVLPLLHTSVPVLGIFKKNSPFMIIYKYNNVGAKEEYCKVYFKILENNLTCYILVFDKRLVSEENHTSPIVLLNNNSCKPSVDFKFQGSKVRITGISGAASTFGNGFTKTFIMNENSPSLSDGLLVNFKKENIIKTIKISTSLENEMARLLIANKFNTAAFANLVNGGHLLHVPFATYLDNGDKRIGSMLTRHCTINCFDVEGENGNGDISENSLIITCVNLVLREQEYRKNKGNNKPTFVTSSTMLQANQGAWQPNLMSHSRDF